MLDHNIYKLLKMFPNKVEMFCSTMKSYDLEAHCKMKALTRDSLHPISFSLGNICDTLLANCMYKMQGLVYRFVHLLK